jgi:hypothetical protein
LDLNHGHLSDSEGASSSSNLKRKWSDEIVILGVKNLRSPEQGMSESPSKEGSVKLRAKKIVKEPDLFALTRRFSLDTKNMRCGVVIIGYFFND